MFDEPTNDAPSDESLTEVPDTAVYTKEEASTGNVPELKQDGITQDALNVPEDEPSTIPGAVPEEPPVVSQAGVVQPGQPGWVEGPFPPDHAVGTEAVAADYQQAAEQAPKNDAQLQAEESQRVANESSTDAVSE